MQLIRFRPEGETGWRPGMLTGETVYDLSARYATLAAFLAAHPDGWDAGPLTLEGFASCPRGEVRLGPPVDDHAAVYAVAANYKEHAEEAGLAVPKQPVIFTKPTTALVGPGEPIRIPPVAEQMDYEGELAVVIGRTVRRVDAERARAAVAGVTVLNDVTARDLQWVDLGKHRIVDWLSAKALDNSTPVGPGIVSIGEAGDPHRLRLISRLNGDVMQDADTSLMVATVWDLIAFLSARVTLRPGDVLSTGTPFGVGGFRDIFLKPGDVVEVEIERVGVLRNEVARD